MHDAEDAAGVLVEAKERDRDLGDLIGLRREAGGFDVDAGRGSEAGRARLR